MEWLSEVVVSQGRLRGLVVKDKEEVELLELCDFFERGLPTKRDVVIRARLRTADFSVANGDEVLPLFGLVLPEGSHSHHTIWQVRVNEHMFFVPSLSLMRAILVPARFMLADFFRPQAIDLVSCSNQETPPKVSLEASWARRAKELRLRDPLPLLQWIHNCPTARAMADSVHVSAMCGKVHMDLPLCEMDLRFSGISHPEGVLVTSVEVMNLESKEKTYSGGDAPNLCSLGKSREKPTAYAPHKELPEYRVLENPDGTVFITDEEWPEVLEILRNFRDIRKGKLDKRKLMDGILVKLHTKAPWRKCSYRIGSWKNASQTFRDLEAKGSLLPVLSYLRECRSS